LLSSRLHGRAQAPIKARSNLRLGAVVTHGTGGLAGTRGILLFDDSTYRGLLP
jgi:hypothetical protein